MMLDEPPPPMPVAELLPVPLLWVPDPAAAPVPEFPLVDPPQDMTAAARIAR